MGNLHYALARTNVLTISMSAKDQKAPEELRDKIGEQFGDRFSDAGPLEFLKSKGYILLDNFRWKTPPHIEGYPDMPTEDMVCMSFLAQEWGYGWLVWPSK